MAYGLIKKLYVQNNASRSKISKSKFSNSCVEFVNTPVKNIKISFTGSQTYSMVADPRGFSVCIKSGHLIRILSTTTVINGEIQDECVWVNKNSDYFPVSINDAEYKSTINVDSNLVTCAKLKDGEVVKTISRYYGQTEFVFIGRGTPTYKADMKYYKDYGSANSGTPDATRTFNSNKAKEVFWFVSKVDFLKGDYTKMFDKTALKCSLSGETIEFNELRKYRENIVEAIVSRYSLPKTVREELKEVEAEFSGQVKYRQKNTRDSISIRCYRDSIDFGLMKKLKILSKMI